MSDKPPESVSPSGRQEVFLDESVTMLEEMVSIDRRPSTDSRLATAADSTDEAILVEAIMATFDGRLTAAERRMDRILAQLGVD